MAFPEIVGPAVPEGLALLTHILRHGELLGELVVDVAGPGTSTSLRDRAEQRQHELVMCRPAAQPGLLLGLVPGLDTPAAGGQRRLGRSAEHTSELQSIMR